MRKFELIEGDMDYRIYNREINGRLTAKRYKILSRYVRVNSPDYSGHCGHEHDCCGCMCGQSMSMDIKPLGSIVPNFYNIKFTLTESFNY